MSVQSAFPLAPNPWKRSGKTTLNVDKRSELYEHDSHITIYFFPRCIVSRSSSCLVVVVIIVVVFVFVFVVVVLVASVRLVRRAFDSGASRLDVRTKELVGRLHKDHRRKAISVVFWFWLGSTRAVLGVEF